MLNFDFFFIIFVLIFEFCHAPEFLPMGSASAFPTNAARAAARAGYWYHAF